MVYYSVMEKHVFWHKDAGWVTKLYRKPELSRLRWLVQGAMQFRHTELLFDRSSRLYCGTDIKLREVGPGILKYCYQLNN